MEEGIIGRLGQASLLDSKFLESEKHMVLLRVPRPNVVPGDGGCSINW